MLFKIKKEFLRLKRYARTFYAFLLCPQTCAVCKAPAESALPLCKNCIKEKIDAALQERQEHPENFCTHCGRLLISEQGVCTSCRLREEENEENFCDRIFSIFSYQDKIGKTLTQWKIFNQRGFADFFARVVFKFIERKADLQNIPLVPVPPRPKKIKTKGWDQIEDLAVQLEANHNIKIFRALKRDDGSSQKSLSSKMRKTNLKGKIHLKSEGLKISETLIILDDVMTTGATLNLCAKTLKEAGCKTVYGLCLFYD